ncbi:MAG: zinc ribbon domain-containing protein [Defluviitaleaceae bacterium]|nr:zinc ribbon domain-containing protein [Defluviitaleaceae bacterium]
MATMDEFKDTISTATKNAVKATKGFVKSAKFSIDLSAEEAKLKATYIEIGKKVHEIYTYGGKLGKFFDEKYSEIIEMDRKIETLRKEIDKARGNKKCAKCGKASSFSNEYCPKCGTDLQLLRADTFQPVYIDAKPQPADSPPALNGKICDTCTKLNPVDSKFCISCGKQI